MVVDQIRQIDKDNDNEISMQELSESMNNGFLNDENNVKNIGELLNNNTLFGLDGELLSSLEQSFYNLKDIIMGKERIDDEDRNILRIFKKILGEKCSEEIQEIDDFIRKQDELDREENLRIEREKEINNEIIEKINNLDHENQNKLKELLNIDGNINSISILDKINNYLSGDIDINNASNILGINILNNIIKDIDKAVIKIDELKQKINDSTILLLNNINEKYANKGNNNKYDKLEYIMLIQLWANVYHGENLKIDGKRGSVHRTINNTNEGRTNYYIWLLEIQTRKIVIDSRHTLKKEWQRTDNLLNIPDWDKAIGLTLPKDVKDKILHTFFNDVYFPARTPGILCENKITGEKMEKILTNMVYAEYYKDIPVGTEIENWKTIQDFCEEGSELYKQCELKIKELGKYNTLGEYYSELVKDKEEEIYLQILNICIESIGKKILNLKDEKDPKKYEDEFKKIATEFTGLRKNHRYKKLLKDQIITMQIFTEINYLWEKEYILKFFGEDVVKEIEKLQRQLDSTTEAENSDNEYKIDLHDNVMNAERNIERGRGRWGESHYTYTNTSYYPAVDNVATPLHPAHPAGLGTTVTHVDTYEGNGHSEYYTTILYNDNPFAGKDVGLYGRVPTMPNSDVTMVGPNPNGWYAILPQELKDKSNQGQIKLAIIMGVPRVYEIIENGDIKLWIYNKEKQKMIPERVLTQAEYLRAITVESSRMKFWEAEHGEEYQRIQEEMKDIMDKNKAVNDLFAERQKKDLDKIETDLLRKGSIKLYNMIESFATSKTRSKLKEMKGALQRLNQDSNSYENPYEKQIKDYINSIDAILGFATKDQVEKAREFKEFCTNPAKVHANEHWYDKTWQERVVIAVSFVVAVAAVIVSITTFGLGAPLAAGGAAAVWAALGIGAISTTTAMVAREVTQIGLNKRTSGGHITVDGVEYELDYNNPTLIEQALDPNSPITFRDCVKGYGTEFVTGTLLQAALMWGGGRASQLISKLIAETPSGSFARRSSEFVCKILCRERNFADSYTEGLINSIEKQAGKQGFMKKFSHELLEESFEEGVEQAAENQGVILGAIATIVHCLKPHPGQALQLAGVGHPEISIPAGQKKIIAGNTYDGSKPENLTILKNYYEGMSGYTVTQEEGGILRVVAHGVSDGNTAIIDSGKDIEMEFRPSKAPLYIRTLSTEILDMGGINVDVETGNITYNSEKKLRALATYYREYNLGNIIINEDGTANIITKDETITLTRSTSDYFDGRSHQFDVIEQQARGNSEMLDNVVESERKISSKEEFDDEFNKIEPENEKQKICLEACKKSFDEAYNELPNLLEEIKQNPSKRQELIEKFMEKYQLSINESKSDGIKWKKTLSNEQKVFFIDAYNSFIFKPLDLKYIDTSITLGGASAFVIDNSKMMDSLAEEMTPENQDIKLNDLREEISRQHTERYGRPLNLTDEQLLAVIEAHKSVGKIGDLTYSELRDKVEILISNKVEDEGVRRFLIESGFCGSVDSRVDGNFIDIEDASPNLNLSQDWVNNSLKTNENGGQRFDSGKAGDELLKLQNKSLNQEGLTQEKVMETIEKIEDPVEKTIAKKLRTSLDSKIPEGDQRVSIEDKAFMLGQSLLFLQNYRTAFPDISPKEAYELLSSNQNKILHQHLWDLNTSTSSDHGIKHILRGNMTLAEKLFEFVNEEGLSPQDVAQRRVLTMQAIIDHDLGYTNFANKLFDEAAFGKGFHMVSDHPLWSTLYVKEHADFYKKYFGEAGYNALITSIPGHSNAQLGYLQNVFNGTATLDQTVRGILSCVDCAGSPGDYKIAFMFAQKEMIGGLFNAKKVLETNNADTALQSLNGLRETVESMPDGPLKDARRKGIDAFLLGVNDKIAEIDGRTKDQDGYQKEIFNEENCRLLLTPSELEYIEDKKLPEEEKAEAIKQMAKEKYGDNLFEELENAEYEKLVLKYPNLFLSEAEIKEIKSRKFDQDPKKDKAIREDEMKVKGRKKWNQMSSAERKKLIIDGKKMKEMNNLFGFKMGKFLGAYGVQTSIDKKTGIPICGKSAEGGFAIQFELAGESFSYLAEQLGTKTALKSFTGVSEDYIIGYEDSHAEAFVIKLIEQVSNKGQIPGKNFDLSNIESIISEFCKSNGTEMLPISENRFSFKGDHSISIEIKSDNSGLILHGPNGIEITLKFDGKSYEGFNSSLEIISEIESKIDNYVAQLDVNDMPESVTAIEAYIRPKISDIVNIVDNEYGDSISWSQEYLDKIADDIVNLDENTSVEEIKQKIKEIRYAYHFNMNTVGTSTNPVDNK